MTIFTSGEISMGSEAGAGRSISAEFGGTGYLSLSAYKAGGGRVPASIAGIPTTDSNIAMSLFHGKSIVGAKGTIPPIIASISGSAFDFGTVLTANGDDGDATLTVVTSGVDDGSTVTVALNGQSYTGAVSVGSAAILVAAADLQALPEGTVVYTVDVTDSAGNAAAQHSGNFIYDATAPSIASSAFDFGAVLYAAEYGDAVLNVTTSGVEDGQTVTLVLDGETYQTGAISDTASFDVLASDLQALTEGTVAYTVDVSDSAGNSAAQHSGSFIYDVTSNYGNFVVDQGFPLAVSGQLYTNAGKGRYYNDRGMPVDYGSISPNNLNGNGVIHFNFFKGVLAKTGFSLLRLEIEGEHAKNYISGITGPFGSGGEVDTLSTSILETVPAVGVALLINQGYQVDGGTTKWFWTVPDNLGPQRSGGTIFPEPGDGPWDGSGNINVTIND